MARLVASTYVLKPQKKRPGRTQTDEDLDELAANLDEVGP